jgi:hypothetical protein
MKQAEVIEIESLPTQTLPKESLVSLSATGELGALAKIEKERKEILDSL